MRVFRYSNPVLLFASVATIVACGRTKEDVADSARVDSLSVARSVLAEQAMQAAMFVNEINKELAKARSLTPTQAKPLQTTSELIEVNDERREALARVALLVERLGIVQGRLAGLRKEIADKDSSLTAQITLYQGMLVEANQAAEHQRSELQTVIDQQTSRIATLQRQVDTLSGAVTQLTTDRNTVYYVVGTKAELIKKGVLVNEGPKRFVVAGSRPVVPSRELDPSVFTRIDRRTDSMIVLPDGGYKIMSRQNAAFVTPLAVKGGKITGALTIEDPEKFWSASRFLILVRS